MQVVVEAVVQEEPVSSKAPLLVDLQVSQEEGQGGALLCNLRQ